MEKRTRSILAGLSLVLVLGFGVPAQSAQHGDDMGWRFDLAPFYIWGINLEGDLSVGTGVGTVSNQIDVPFEDVFSNLEGLFIFHIEAAKDNRWGFFLDTNYLDISGDRSLPANAKLKVEFAATIFEAAGFYRIAAADQHHFDVLLGGRYTNLETSISFSGPAGLGAEKDLDWVDPFVGLRWRWSFTDSLKLILRGDVGGFGVGSDLAWKAAGLLYWQPFTHVSFIGGYQGLYQDYEDGTGRDYFNLDVTIHGPVLGINFTW